MSIATLTARNEERCATLAKLLLEKTFDQFTWADLKAYLSTCLSSGYITNSKLARLSDNDLYYTLFELLTELEQNELERTLDDVDSEYSDSY